MKIRQLNQLEEIYDLVNRTTSEGRSDEIADFLGIDSYIISGLLNKDSPIPIKRSSIFSKDYTHMTPAQFFLISIYIIATKNTGIKLVRYSTRIDGVY